MKGVDGIVNKGKKIAIVQSNYIPWKGYFDLIRSVDEFILFDDMQYTRRDWRNRNKIKTRTGNEWITIPVQVKGNYYQKIKDTLVGDTQWNRSHWKKIVHNYSKARYFNEYRDIFETMYLQLTDTFLSDINLKFINMVCALLGIETKITWSMEYRLIDGKTERLIDLCEQAGAAEYLSGPTAKGYIDEELFQEAGIRLTYVDYSGYPEYSQLFPPFNHAVSIIDLIFNEGPNASNYMKSL